MARFIRFVLLFCFVYISANGQSLSITKIDPPNWYVSMPAPMLLVRGTGLSGAHFTISDRSITIKKTEASENGHWAQLWLSKSPAKAKTVTIAAQREDHSVTAKYEFRPRHASPQGFSSRDVMYLLMPDRFADGDRSNDGPHAVDSASSEAAKAELAKPRGWHGGDLQGVEQHLDYLNGLGITALWMTPIDENLGAESYHGYHATDMYAVDPHFGSMQDLKLLSASLHSRKMKLILDTVPNHVGSLHPWVNDPPTPDWFHGTAEHHIAGETNFRALIDAHAPVSARAGTLFGWFADQLPDMNTENPAVEKYLVQNAEWWIEEAEADALRIDTFPYIDRTFWHQYLGELHRLFPRLTEVGEVVDTDPVITSSFADGVTRAGVDTKLYTPFDFPTFFALRDVLMKGASFKRVADTLADDSLYPHPERLVVFYDNHDNARLQSDEKSTALLQIADAFVMTTRGTPQLYYGDEIAMQGADDPDNRRDFPGGFQNQKRSAFETSAQSPQEKANIQWISELSSLRRKYAELSVGSEQILHSSKDWLVYARGPQPETVQAGVSGHSKNRYIIVALHRGDSDREAVVPRLGTWVEHCHVDAPILNLNNGKMSDRGSNLVFYADQSDLLLSICHE